MIVNCQRFFANFSNLVGFEQKWELIIVSFYSNFLKLCSAKNVSPSRAASAIGLSNAAASGWKNGKVPQDTTVQKLADYFGVSVADLMSEKSGGPAHVGNGLTEAQRKAVELVMKMSDEQLKVFVATLKAAEEKN